LLFLRQKNEAFPAFIKFGAIIETTIRRKIKVLQNDWGGIFYLRNFKKIWTKMAYFNNFSKQICFPSTMLQKRKNACWWRGQDTWFKKMEFRNFYDKGCEYNKNYLVNWLFIKVNSRTTPLKRFTIKALHLNYLKIFDTLVYIYISTRKI